MKELFIAIIGRIVAYVPLPQSIQNLILWPVASRVLGVGFTKEIPLKSGVSMQVGIEDMLNRALLFKGPYMRYVWEPVTIRLLEQLSRQKKAILIAGSHIGYTVLMAAKETNAAVVACEPVAYLYDRSKRNFELNTATTHITLIKAALGNSEGSAEMHIANLRSSIIPYSGAHIGAEKETVRLTTIDTIARETGHSNFDLIFLDVEGYELFALQGAQANLAHTPDLILEVCPQVLAKSGQTKEALYSYLTERGYKIYIINDMYESDATNTTPVVRLISIESPKSAPYANSRYFNIFATVRDRASLDSIAGSID
jgi:FkbM family methyltransferase